MLIKIRSIFVRAMLKVMVSLSLVFAHQAYSALDPASILQFTKGNNAPLSSVRCTSGSCFSVDVDASGGIFYWIPIESFHGLAVNTIQQAGGSHIGSPNGTEHPNIDKAWEFAGRTGMHLSTLPVSILADDGAGNVVLDFSGWGLTRDGDPLVPLSAGAFQANADGEALLQCSNTCESGDLFTLTYSAKFNSSAPFFFANANYQLVLRGVVSTPIEDNSASAPKIVIKQNGVAVNNAVNPAAGNVELTTTVSGQSGFLYDWSDTDDALDNGVSISDESVTGIDPLILGNGSFDVNATIRNTNVLPHKITYASKQLVINDLQAGPSVSLLSFQGGLISDTIISGSGAVVIRPASSNPNLEYFWTVPDGMSYESSLSGSELLLSDPINSATPDGVYTVAVRALDKSTTPWTTSSGQIDIQVLTIPISGSSSSVLLDEDFDPVDPSAWSYSNAIIQGAQSQLVPYFYDGNALHFAALLDGAKREAMVGPLNMAHSGTLEFHLKIGNGSPYFEQVDMGEDIIVEYSTNNGVTWGLISRFTHMDSEYVGQWGLAELDIPDMALTNNTYIRWRQIAYSGSSYDHWAIDNIVLRGDLSANISVVGQGVQSIQPGFVANSIGDNGIDLSLADLDNAGLPRDAESYIQCHGRCFDLDIDNSDNPGGAIRIVFLMDNPLGQSPRFRQFSTTSFTWNDFIVGGDESIESASALNGVCPNPGDAAYTPGLRQGDLCVQITVVDNGPNDNSAIQGKINIFGDIGMLPPDADGDGLYDFNDNCPFTSNVDQLDSDSDGVGNACDNCLNSRNSDQLDADSDGFGDVCDNCILSANVNQDDLDNDGVGDVCDNCSSVYNPTQDDIDYDSVGDLCDNCVNASNVSQIDADADGVGNVCDNCVTAANLDQIDSDYDAVGDACDNCASHQNYSQIDTDSDGVGNVCDNCTNASNADQRDSNSDGYGNVCDADLNNDGTINFVDMGNLRASFFTSNADADLNGDNIVNFVDLGIMKQQFFQPPGPSGYHPQ